MSNFTRDAAGALRAAELALSGRAHAPHRADDVEQLKRSFAPAGMAGYGYDAVISENDARTLELLRQLQVALSEIASLRSELSVEKETRSHALVALGRRWKEEVAVELRSSDYGLRRDVAELQFQVGERLKEQSAQNAVLRRQVEELQRAAKVRDSTQFDRQESVQEELEALRAKVEAATVQSTSTRVECAQQLERERAGLERRLDVELVRFADARRDEQKELRAARELIHSEVQKVGSTVRAMVDDAWRSCAASLEKTVTERSGGAARELTATKAAVESMDEKIASCVRTCQSEVRLLGTTLTERVAALEANEAVAASRIDRAEKKADAAHDATARMDAELTGAKEAVAKATGVAQRAAEQTQQYERALMDRDARMVQVEAQLQGIASSEKLKAEIEGVKRTSTRLESQVDAVSRVCERAEALAERTSKAADAVVERVGECERQTSRAGERAKTVLDSQQQLTQRVAVVEDLRDRLAVSIEQSELAAARAEQRHAAHESKQKQLTDRQSQLAKDTQSGQLQLSARLEAAQESITRSETLSSAAKVEVERLEKRLLLLESSHATMSAECASAKATVEENTRDVDLLRRQAQQAKEVQEARGARVDERLTGVDNLDSTIADKISHLERKVGKQLEGVTQQTAGTTRQLEENLQASFTRFQSHIEKQVSHSMHDLQRRMREQTNEPKITKRLETAEALLASLQTAMTESSEQLEVVDTMRHTMGKLESYVRHTSTERAQQLQDLKEQMEAVMQRAQQRQEADASRLEKRLGTIESAHAREAETVDARLQELTGLQQRAQARLGSLSEEVTTAAERAVAEWLARQPRAAPVEAPAAPQLSATLSPPSALTPKKAQPLSVLGKSEAAATATASTPPRRVDSPGRAQLTASSTATENAAAHISGISPVAASPGAAAVASRSSSSSLVQALAGPGSDVQPKPNRLFGTPAAESASAGSLSRSKSEEGEASQPSASSAGLPPPAPAQEPKRLPPPTTLEARSADTTGLGGASTLGQRTTISKFVPHDDDETTTSTTSPSRERPRATRPLAAMLKEDDDSTSPITSASESPAPKTAAAAAAAAAAAQVKITAESSAAVVTSTAARAETASVVAQPPSVTDPAVAASAAGRPAIARAHTWDDSEDSDDDDGAPADAEEQQEGGSEQHSPSPHGSSTDSDGELPSLELPMGHAEAASDDEVVPMAQMDSTPQRHTDASGGATPASVESSPAPRSVLATGSGAALRATPRRDFVGAAEAPLEGEEVPRHGQATTSSSSSGSKGRASSAGSQPQAAKATPAAGKYGSFDDSSSDGDEAF